MSGPGLRDLLRHVDRGVETGDQEAADDEESERLTEGLSVHRRADSTCDEERRHRDVHELDDRNHENPFANESQDHVSVPGRLF